MRSTKNTGHKEETYADLYGCGTGRAPTGKENIRTDETSLYRNRAYFAGTVKGAGKYSRTGAHKCRRDRGGTYRYDQSADRAGRRDASGGRQKLYSEGQKDSG